MYVSIRHKEEQLLLSLLLSPSILHSNFNPFTTIYLYGMSQIKAWVIPFLILRVESVKGVVYIYTYTCI